MNTNFSTGINGIHEFSADNLDSVSGDNPVVSVPMGLVEKVLDNIFLWKR